MLRIEARVSLDRQVPCYCVTSSPVVVVVLWLRASLGRHLLCYRYIHGSVVVVAVVVEGVPWQAVDPLLCYIHGPVFVALFSIPGNDFISLCLYK